MDIKEVGYFSPNSSDSINFFSHDYFIDSNVLLVRLSMLKAGLESTCSFLHSGMVNNEEAILDYWLKRKADEVLEFYKHNGQVIIIADIKPIIYYSFQYFDKKKEVNLLKIFTSSEVNFNIKMVAGEKFINNSILGELFAKAKSGFEFVFSNLDNKVKILSTTVKTKESISFLTKILNGKLLVLNKIDFDHEVRKRPDFFLWFIDHANTIFGLLSDDLQSIIEESPSWLKDHTFKEEEKLKIVSVSLKKQMDELENRILINSESIYNYNVFKSVLYTSGKHLEIGVGKCLEKLTIKHFFPSGFETDLVINDGEVLIAIEIKGVSGSASLRNSRQLEDWVNRISEKYDREDVKGLLIINSYNNIPVKERNEINFPPNVIEFSRARKHCLMTTITLLKLISDFDDKIINKNDILELIQNTQGELKYNESI